ncbi:MAG: hypothetical protein JWQ35_1865, partial [Bacteriovoracaceae bacterium]|nr:hypothetical protein [Bacteriovoracaceae bacterium]
MPIKRKLYHKVALAQGFYYFLTGIWPIISIKSFEKITGRKTDKWLVKTFGLILALEGL